MHANNGIMTQNGSQETSDIDTGIISNPAHDDNMSASDSESHDLQYYQCDQCTHSVPEVNRSIHNLRCPGRSHRSPNTSIKQNSESDDWADGAQESESQDMSQSEDEINVAREWESDDDQYRTSQNLESVREASMWPEEESFPEDDGNIVTRPRIPNSPNKREQQSQITDAHNGGSGYRELKPRIPPVTSSHPNSSSSIQQDTTEPSVRADGARNSLDASSDDSNQIKSEDIRPATARGPASRDTDTSMIDLISSDDNADGPQKGPDTGYGIRKRKSSDSADSTSSGYAQANAMYHNTRSKGKGKAKVEAEGAHIGGGPNSGTDSDGRVHSRTGRRSGDGSRLSNSRNSNRSTQVGNGTVHSQGRNTRSVNSDRGSANHNRMVGSDVEMDASSDGNIDVDAMDDAALTDWQVVRENFRRASLGEDEDLRMGPIINPSAIRRNGDTSDDEVVVLSAADVDSDQRAEEGWACPQCTFQNHAHMNVCEMCSSPRSAAGANGDGVQRVRRRTDIQGQPDETRNNEPKWSCAQCTFENDATDSRCEMCRTSRPGAKNIGSNSYGSDEGGSDDDTSGASLGGALLGMMGGAAMAYMTGQSVGPSMMRGAMTGAITGNAAAAMRQTRGVPPDVRAQLMQRREYMLQQHQQQMLQQQGMGSSGGPNQANRMPGTRLVFTPSGPNGQRVTQRRVVGYGVSPDAIDNMSYEELMQRFPTQVGRPANRGLIHALPTEVLTNNAVAKLDEGSQQCCICLEDFKAGERMKRLPCLHSYHDHCIDEWLSRRGTCPVCKHALE